MYRVLLALALACSMASCGTSRSVVASLNGDAHNPYKVGTKSTPAQNTPAPVQTASTDKAPKGVWEKAPKGVLSDRNYELTRLEPETARDLVNEYRKKHGLKPLQLNTQLTLAAKEHSRDLAKWDRISHYGSDGSNPWDRVKRTGYNPRVTAENVGTGQASFDEVLKGWRDSAGHNKNLLLADATQMGIALVQDPKTEFKTFWTLVLGSPK
ncbi:MAG: CAP domain-containing protein [Hyphomicrobiaceae bacterium]|nr:MAG: CAP domain-containing protein [Hyphomicrobiaceae bacterium]